MTNVSIINSPPLNHLPEIASASIAVLPSLPARVNAIKRALPTPSFEVPSLVSTSKLEKAMQGPLGGLSTKALHGFGHVLRDLEALCEQSHPEIAEEIDNIGWELEALVQDIQDSDLAGIIAKQYQQDPSELNQQKVQTLLSRINKLQRHAKKFKPRWDTLLQKRLNRFDSSFAKIEAEAHTEHFAELEKSLQKAHRKLAPLVTQEKCYPEDPGLFADLPMPKRSPKSEGLVGKVCSVIFPLMLLANQSLPMCNVVTPQSMENVHAISLTETPPNTSSQTLPDNCSLGLTAHQQASIVSANGSCPAFKKPTTSYEMSKLFTSIKEGLDLMGAIQIAEEFHDEGDLDLSSFITEAVSQAAKHLVADDYPYTGEARFEELVNNRNGIKEAIQVAEHLVAGDDTWGGAGIFIKLVEKGQGIDEAIHAAEHLVARDDKWVGIQIFEVLVKNGHGIEEAIQAAERLVAGDDTWVGKQIFKELVKNGHGIEEAIHAAEQLVARGDTWNGGLIFEMLAKNGHGNEGVMPDAVRELITNGTRFITKYASEITSIQMALAAFLLVVAKLDWRLQARRLLTPFVLIQQQVRDIGDRDNEILRLAQDLRDQNGDMQEQVQIIRDLNRVIEQAQAQAQAPEDKSAILSYDVFIGNNTDPECIEDRSWQDLKCPITRDVFYDPVRLKENPRVVYERSIILKRLETNPRDPVTNALLTKDDLEDAPGILKKIITSFKRQSKRESDPKQVELCKEAAAIRRAVLILRTLTD